MKRCRAKVNFGLIFAALKVCFSASNRAGNSVRMIGMVLFCAFCCLGTADGVEPSVPIREMMPQHPPTGDFTENPEYIDVPVAFTPRLNASSAAMWADEARF